MRVLRLDLGRTRIELHPFVTVVRGLTPEARARLLDVLAALPQGTTPVGGLIEAHGVLLDLAPATLELLDLHEPLDVVVRAADLPGPVGSSRPAGLDAARAAVAHAEAALSAAQVQVAAAVDRRRAADEALAGGDGAASAPEPDPSAEPDAIAATRAARAAAADALAEAEAQHQRAVEALRDVEAAALVARDHRRDAARALSVAAAALETAGDRRDDTAAAVVEAARARLQDAEAVLEQVRAGGPSAVDEPVDVEALQADRLRAQAALLALDSTDPLPVQAALDRLRGNDGPDLVPVPEAMALADELADVEEQLGRMAPVSASQAGVQHEERDVARRRVELAEQALAELEAQARRPIHDPADVAALEAAHLDVLEAREGTSKRFGAAKAVRRLEELERVEQQVLDRMGLLTYTEFLMAAGGPSGAHQIEESLPARIEAAREELAKAEAQLESREIDVGEELTRAALLDRRRTLRAKAVELLGTDPGSDVEGALRRMRVEASTTGEHLDRLRGALEGAGVVLDDEDVDEPFLVDLAKVWLEEQGETEAQRRAYEREIAAIDVHLAAAEARQSAPSLDEPLAEAAGAVEDARRALEAAESRQARAAAAEAEIGELRAAFAAASDADAEAAAALAAAEDEVRRAADAATEAATAVVGAQGALDVAAAGERAAREAAVADEERLEAAQSMGRQALEAEQREAAAAVAAAEAAAAAAAAQRRAAQAELDALEAAAVEAAEASGPAGATGDPGPAGAATSADDVEWYLLARLAAQRSVSYAGSVPLVLDDALAQLDPEATRSVLDRLERMAATVQLVLVTEDLTTAAWAEDLGEARAQVTEVGAAAS